jgi:NDP-sugar pyrophosphorylase family protein
MIDTTSPRAEQSVGAIVLAGVYCWSGSPFDQLRPRPLLPVALSPLVMHVLDWLSGGGITETTICANGSTPVLRHHLDNSYRSSMRVQYYEDGSPRGAAGCVKDAGALTDAEVFLVTDGTSIPTADIAGLLQHHRETGAAMTVVARRCLTKLSGQPQRQPTGTYVVNRDVLDAVPATSYQDIKENLIPRLYAQGRHIALYSVDDVSPRVLSAGGYLALNRWMVERMAARLNQSEGTADTTRTVIAHPTARVSDEATVVGPVVLGAGARIRSSAVVVGPTIIGAGTTVGEGAVVTRSVVWEDCTIGERAVLDQCLLADEACVEPETTLRQVLHLTVPDRADSLQALAARRLERPVRTFKAALS